jgi:hypothetical protein
MTLLYSSAVQLPGPVAHAAGNLVLELGHGAYVLVRGVLAARGLALAPGYRLFRLFCLGKNPCQMGEQKAAYYQKHESTRHCAKSNYWRHRVAAPVEAKQG